jgi:hypothetical protein
MSNWRDASAVVKVVAVVVERVWVAEGVVANASLSRSAVDTSLSKGASAEEAWAIMCGK